MVHNSRHAYNPHCKQMTSRGTHSSKHKHSPQGQKVTRQRTHNPNCQQLMHTGKC